MRDKKHLEEIVKNDFPGFIQMLEVILDFNRWGFQQTFSGVATQFPLSVIYDSEYCRVRFMWGTQDMRDRYATIYIMYGRLHAPNDMIIMPWNGEESWCWHDVNTILYYLDGLSPQETVKIGSKWPPVMEHVRQSEIGNDLEYEGHDFLIAKMHAAVWKYYGQRFFELLDLRHPDLWERYCSFRKDIRIINYENYKKRNYRYPKTYGEPPEDKIC
jgi:hypothetical protein